MSGRSAHPFRRTAAVAVVAMVATGVALLAPGFAAADEEFVNGSGRGKASILRVGPSASQLSLAPSVGVALTDYIGTLGRGEALIFDYAALDTTVNGSAPDLKRQFPPLRVESRDPASAAGVRWEPKPGLVETGQATTSPVGRSAMAIEGFNIPGVIEVTGGKARSFSGVYFRTQDGRRQLVRAAGGTVDIPRVSIGGGLIVLENLRWEVAQLTDRNDDADPEALGGFTVGRFISQGETQGEGLTHEELGQIFGPLNEQLLSHVGIFVEAPTFRFGGDVASVTPLRVSIASNHFAPLGVAIQELRDAPSDDPNKTISRRIIDECQAQESAGASSSGSGGGGGGGGGGGDLPLGRPDPGSDVHAQAASGGGEREEFDEFQRTGPDGPKGEAHHEPPGNVGGSDCGVPFLVADLALAPLTGFGQFDFDLGGALGVTEGSIFEGFNLFGSDFGGGGSTSAPPAAVPSRGGGTAVLSSGAGSTSTPVPEAAPAAPPTQGGRPGEVAAPRVFKLTGSRASAAWAVGLVGLGAALAMAASDYRRLRLRRRAVTPIT